MKKDVSLSEARGRIAKLREAIDKYRYEYHVLDKSSISPEALDSLKKELFDLEGLYPQLVTLDSPTQRIGGKPAKGFEKVRHEQLMLSFNDAFSEEDVGEWFLRAENYLKRKIEPNFYCELKIDGLAVELEYEDGVFIRGSTRGDGIVGEDVTQNLKTIEAIPLRIKTSKRLVVRGEVFLTKKEFERINKDLEKREEKIYANPRNLAAGSIRQLDPKIIAGRKLDSFAYDIVVDSGQEFSLSLVKNTHYEKHDVLRKLGFKTNPHNKQVYSIKDVFEFRNYWEKHRGGLPYEIDGVVVAIGDNSIFKELGFVGKAPRAAIAYKFSPKEVTTKIVNIRVQIGRTGVLTPVAELEPVQVGGVTISNATLHNYDEIQRLGLKIGDTVVVSRAGDVIPKIIRVMKELRTGRERVFHMPIKCPIDNSEIIVEGALHRCSNLKCGARQRELLYHFVSRAAFDIRGLGHKIIDRFADEGFISDPADIFTLDENKISVLPRFGRKSAENIINEIKGKKKTSLRRFIYALGILHVGEETSQMLAAQVFERIKNNKLRIKDIFCVMQKFSFEELQDIPDVGPKVAGSIYKWFHDKGNACLLEKLEEVGVEIESFNLKVEKNGRLTGKSFVFTGGLESMARNKAKELVRNLGGSVHESVSKDVDYVVAGGESSSKYRKAKELGVMILSEEDFLKLIKD